MHETLHRDARSTAAAERLNAPTADPALIAGLRGRLAEVGFTSEGIRNACSGGMSQDPWSLATGQPPRDGSPFSTLLALFWSGGPVDVARAEAALAPIALADLEEAGLVEVRDGLAHPLCLLRPVDQLLVASDVPALLPDRVLGVVPASETLANLTVRRPVKRALDLGTGCGVQGLLLAGHCETVISIDVNPRALAYASLNAGLNEALNMQVRQGSWFDQVDDERFDTIACNPPYVISPETAYTYRDGGLPRDAVSQMVVREAARHLADGGFATILCNWIHDEAVSNPIASWVAGTGCDALLLHYATVDSAGYAARWNNELQARASGEFATTMRRWLDYYRAENITHIGLGAVILRRRPDATNWVRALTMATGPSCPCSDHILRLFDAADFLESRRGPDLLPFAFTFVDGHRVDQTLAHPAGKYVAGPAIFRSLPGLGVEARIDPAALEVLLECDGQRVLGDLVTETAERRHESASAVAALIEEPVRQLVERGFMIPGGERC